jgi:hypothetical protein
MRLRSVWRCALTAVGFCSVGLVSCSLPAGTVWNYDFGSDTGAFTDGESTTFLPSPFNGGGTARVRIGTGDGQFDLVNPGSGRSMLVGTAAANSSVNKFSIYDFSGTGLFTFNAEVTFGGGAGGSWYLLAGNGDRFSNNNSFANSEVFVGLRWDYGNGGELTTTRLSSSSKWLSTTIPTTAQDTTYRLKIHANNTETAVEHAGQTVAPGTWDLFVNDVLVADALPKAGLAETTPIDSFMFYGMNSAGNLASLSINSVSYANVLAPEPDAFVLFAAGAACWGAVIWKRRRFRRLEPPVGCRNWPTTGS